MNFLVDAHLSKGICQVLQSAGHDVIHTRDLPQGNRTPDQLINDISMRELRVVVSKDTDFYYSHILEGKPWRLILIRTGNMRGRDLISAFHSSLPVIENALKEYTLIEFDRESVRALQ